MSNFSLGKIGGHKAHSPNTRYAVRSLFHNVAQPKFFPALKILSGVKIHGLPNFPRQNFRGKKPRITLGIIRTF